MPASACLNQETLSALKADYSENSKLVLDIHPFTSGEMCNVKASRRVKHPELIFAQSPVCTYCQRILPLYQLLVQPTSRTENYHAHVS